MKLVFVGKHGGANKSDKLNASLRRLPILLKIIRKFAPDLTISCCSPEAARISYGLGIKHIAFSDSPHAEAVMRLSVPFVEKLLIPWIIPKKEFTKYGIAEKDILQYKAIDASVIAKQNPKKDYKINFSLTYRKTILIRVDESQAAYFSHKKDRVSYIISKIAKEFRRYNIIVLGRYSSQIKKLKKKFGTKVRILDEVVDGKALLSHTDVFVGSGGTMTAEAALLGVYTISYDSIPNHIEKYLVRKKLVKREKNPKKIVMLIRKELRTHSKHNKKKARKILNSMEDPFSKLVKVMKYMKK